MEGWERFTAEDAEFILGLIEGSAGSLGEHYNIYDTGIWDQPVIPDLECFVVNELGVTDPIGQLGQWLKDQLEAIASWIATQVQDLLKWLWDSFIKPGLDALGNALRQVYEGIVDSLEYLFNVIKGWVSDLGSTINNALTQLASRFWDALTQFANALSNLGSQLWELMSNVVSQVGNAITNAVSQLWSWIQSALANVANALQGIAQRVWDAITSIGSTVVNTISSWASQLWGWIQDGLTHLASLVTSVLTRVWDAITSVGAVIKSGLEQVWSWIQQVPTMIQNALRTFWGWVQSALAQVANALQGIAQRVWEALKGVGAWISSAVKQLWTWIQEGFTQVVNFFRGVAERVWNGIRWLGEQFQSALIHVWESIKGFGEWVYQGLSQLWSWIQQGFAQIVNFFRGVAEKFWDGIKWVVQEVESIPKFFESFVAEFEKRVWAAINWLWKQLSELYGKITGGFEWLAGKFADVVKHIQQLAAMIQGGFTQLTRIPEALWSLVPDWFRNAMKAVGDAFGKFMEFVKDPAKFFAGVWNAVRSGLVKLWSGLEWVGEQLVEAGRWVWDALTKALTWLWNQIVSVSRAVADTVVAGVKEIMDALFFKPLSAVGKNLEQAWFTILAGKSGELQLLFDVARSFLWEYYWATLLVYVITGLAETLGDFEVWIQPEILGSQVGGSKFRIQFSKLVESFVKAIKEFYPNFLLGSMFGLASTILRPVEYVYRAKFVEVYDGKAKEIFADVLKQEIKEGATISMFVEAPTINELLTWVRRMIAVRGGIPAVRGAVKQVPPTIVPDLATFKAHLKLRGLPEWFIEYLSDVGEKLVVTFTDRFGVTRGVWLGEIFELPTHSELARMTQRDIFPSIYEMQKVAWTRGWNPDLTRMIYLLTFKYPSFTNLWRFYMRATAGMLWFSPPESIRQVFSAEAEALGAGVPVAPLDIQSRIKGPQQFSAFELALNTYFKWLEYSNFSWFTPQTCMYGINIGAQIYGALGGWPADSWIMADVAADIPGKIDLRWMSRFGIFIWLAERAGKAGVAFQSYAPLVKVVPSLLEANAASPIQVDLRWFSKLLQATGLHPAWVPITTVAENIMVISDEMTLLRTGWLRLFKEGMLSVQDVESYLSGMITVSYLVGYWDPATKQWTSRYVNLPVRWLPHERRLLELRMLMDRVYDVFREIYGFIRAGIRSLAVKPEDALSKLKELISMLDAHYSSVAKAITGKEMHIALDESYAQLWLKAEELAISIEAITRVRYWWFRVAGWLLYRISYGYVTIQDVEALIDALGKVIPIYPTEREAYLAIANVLLGIIRREYVPTPSQLATIAEVVPEAAKMIAEVLRVRHVPKDWWPIWEKYVEVKPIVDEVRKLLTAYERAKYRGINLGRLEGEVLNIAKQAGWTQRELNILSLRIGIEELIEASKEYLPTPYTLATLAEYINIPAELVGEVLTKRRVPKEWVSLWLRFIKVKPLYDDVKALARAFFRLKRYADEYGVSIGDVEGRVMSILREYGWSSAEISVREFAVQLEVMADEIKEAGREWVPTVSMLASISEWVRIPQNLIRDVFRYRHVKPEWQAFWLKYLRIAPYRDDFRAFLREYFYVKVWGWRIRGIEELANKLMIEFNFTDFEKMLFEVRARIHRQRYAWNEVRYWLRATLRNLAYGVAHGRVSTAEVNRFFETLKRSGYTDEEVWAMKQYFESYVRSHYRTHYGR